MSKILEFPENKKSKLEDILAREIGSKEFLLCAKAGEDIISYRSPDLKDIDECYMLDTLQMLRLREEMRHELGL